MKRKPAKKPVKRRPVVSEFANVETSQATAMRLLADENAKLKTQVRERSQEVLDLRDAIRHMTPDRERAAARADVQAEYGAKFLDLSRQVEALQKSATNDTPWRSLAFAMFEQARSLLHRLRYGDLREVQPVSVAIVVTDLIALFERRRDAIEPNYRTKEPRP